MQTHIQSEQIQQLVRPLVLSGLYKSEETALKDIVFDFVNHKIEGYKQEIKKFENKYSTEFDKFSEVLKNDASIEQEDDWMDWKAALEMQKAWSETLKTMMLETSA